MSWQKNEIEKRLIKVHFENKDGVYVYNDINIEFNDHEMICKSFGVCWERVNLLGDYSGAFLVDVFRYGYGEIARRHQMNGIPETISEEDYVRFVDNIRHIVYNLIINIS